VSTLPSESDLHMIEDIFSSFQVKVLYHDGPSAIYVRRIDEEEALERLELALKDHYTNSSSLIFPALASVLKTPGSLVAVQDGSSWHRATVLTPQPHLRLRLIDRGDVVSLDPRNVYQLVDFLADIQAWPPLVTRCHLFPLEPGQATQEKRRELEVILQRAESVVLHRRGSSHKDTVTGEISAPVDLFHRKVRAHHPFKPSEELEESFVKLMNLVSLEDFDSGEEVTLEDSSDENLSVTEARDEDFAHVKPFYPGPEFDWLPPELPPSGKFLARGTFVDGAGQIHIQLHSNRSTVRVLRQLLNEKLTGSKPDCALDSFRPGQACSVRYRKDGSWYRARFLAYGSRRDGGTEFTDKAEVLLVDWGTLTVASVSEDLRSAVYGELVPIQALATVIHNIVPEGDHWQDEELDFLMETINYGQCSYNQLLEVTCVEDIPVSYPLPVTLNKTVRCASCLEARTYRCSHVTPIDISTLLSKFGVILGHMVAFQHHGLIEVRKQYSFYGCVAQGTYKEKNVFLQLVPSSLPLLPPSCFQQCLPHLDLKKLGVQPGALIPVMRMGEVSAFDKVTLQLWGEAEGSGLDTEVQQHLKLVEESTRLQAACRTQAPVMLPSLGLPVIVTGGESLGLWCRAIVTHCARHYTEVTLVDVGTKKKICDSQQIREMPPEWVHFPRMGVTLSLSIEPLEDVDILQGLVMECLGSLKKNCWVKVVKLQDAGFLEGQLVDEYGMAIYKGLVREGVIRLVE